MPPADSFPPWWIIITLSGDWRDTARTFRRLPTTHVFCSSGHTLANVTHGGSRCWACSELFHRTRCLWWSLEFPHGSHILFTCLSLCALSFFPCVHHDALGTNSCIHWINASLALDCRVWWGRGMTCCHLQLCQPATKGSPKSDDSSLYRAHSGTIAEECHAHYKQQ